jgi:two-component system phosphate regulon sensor histidine kinase PhoR
MIFGLNKLRRQPDRLDAEQLLSWLEESPQGLLVIDPWNRLQHINSRARRLLNLTSSAILNNRYLLEVVRCHQLDAAVTEARISNNTQRVKWIVSAVSASPLEPETISTEPLEALAIPGTAGWVGVFIQSCQSLQSQQQQQERWISDVAHELRTPLTALSLVTESLALNPSKKQVVQIERLQRELERLQRLVSDLLELNRLDNPSINNSQKQLENVEIRDLLSKAWQSIAPLAENREVDLVLETSGAHNILGDSTLLHRAILNLLDNALRFSPDQSEINVKLSADGRWQRIEVRDQGNGFSAEDLQHMFERFYRGDPSRARGKRVGSGLGLAIVQQIAAAHGGHIRGLNHSGGGALLILSLPVAP